MEIIKVLLLDDHQIILDGVKTMILNEPNISICGAYVSGKEALENAAKHKPDIIITDIMMPDMSGLEFVRNVKSLNISAKILILSMFLSADYIQNAAQAGANGFLMKQNATRDELMTAINSLMAGKNYFNTEVANTIISGIKNDSNDKATGNEKQDLSDLSKRELEVLKLFANGYSNKEISDRLFISVRTVETHKTNMIGKLNLRSYVDLIKIAIKNNLSEL
ncbi:MAG: response regulator transcription factor [Bacteroidota bacterium]